PPRRVHCLNVRLTKGPASMSTSAESPVAARRVPVRAIALVVLAALFLGGVFAFSRRSAGEAEGKRKPPVAATAPASAGVGGEPPRLGRFGQPLRVTGTLRSDETVVLSTKATGLVKAVTVKEGDRVRRGQLLVEIDDRDLHAQRDRAVATIGAEEAAVRE